MDTQEIIQASNLQVKKKRKSRRRRRKKGLKHDLCAAVGSPATSGMSKLPSASSYSQTSSGPNVSTAQNIRAPDKIELTFGSFVVEVDASRSSASGFQVVGDIKEPNDESDPSLSVSHKASSDDASPSYDSSESQQLLGPLELQNFSQAYNPHAASNNRASTISIVQQQPQAMPHTYPLVHVSHQKADNIHTIIDEAEASTLASPPALGGFTSAEPPSATPPGGPSTTPPALGGPLAPPPSARTPHLAPRQNHYWTVVHADGRVEFSKLNTKKVMEECHLDEYEEKIISCDMKHPSYVLRMTDYTIVLLPDIFFITGREKSYIRHDEAVRHMVVDPLVTLPKFIAKSWSGRGRFDLHVMECIFHYTLEGLRNEKKTLSQSANPPVARIKDFIRKNRNIKQIGEKCSDIFRDEREMGAFIPFFICCCEDTIRSFRNMVQEDEEKIVERNDAIESRLIGAMFASIFVFWIVINYIF